MLVVEVVQDVVAKISTIKRKLRTGEKMGFSEKARAVAQGLVKSKAKKNVKKKRPKSRNRKKA